VALIATALAGCAQLPSVDRDIAHAPEAAKAEGHIELLRQEGERIGRAPFVSGNAVELLRNGAASYRAMAGAIAAAKQRIDMESYIFDQEVGGRFAELLLEKRAQGVEVNLIYDAWGSFETPSSVFDRLRQGGVRVLEYNPLVPNERVGLTINHRDHRKLLVVDAKQAVMGGVNISAVYELRQHAPTRPAPVAGTTADEEELPWRWPRAVPITRI
jgi:cardiolipin synthase